MINRAKYIRTKRYGSVWEAVFKRDRYQCIECGADKRLHLDHVIPVSKGGKSILENLQVLCISCHARKTSREKDLDPKREKKRNYIREWSKLHPGYFSEKLKEFRKNNPRRHQEDRHKQYEKAKVFI